MAQGTFDLWQQTFTLAMMANAERGQTGSATQLADNLSSAIQDRLGNSGLQSLIGSSWEIAWGPCVSQAPDSTYADNAMYVAHDTVNNIYVVAIAATNYASTYDIDIEDLDVTPIPWPYGSSAPNGTKIATGTNDGVTALLAMQSQGQTLLSYLQGRTDASTSTLIFTGHSLGGALAPTLALALTTLSLTPSDWKAMYVYPLAGPTSGNAAFATYFSQTFHQSATGSQPWQVWNADLANRLDTVPCAWNEQTLSSIPNLYTPNITASPEVRAKVAGLEVLALGSGYTRIGTANDLTGSSVQGSGNTEAVFEQEALYQHIYAYFLLLGVQTLLTLSDGSGHPLFNPPNPYASTSAQPVLVDA
ncbi:MAG TPA: hypothetical protein VIA62_11745 [Thermoanaerobaculia bacterium]|jgi:hypothetical protein|nr:hypothetical protein [Thermoanaerobaculia bacterium]